jgi:hypothetical protein
MREWRRAELPVASWERISHMPTATTGSANIEIDAPPLTVYQLVSDITRMGDRSPER